VRLLALDIASTTGWATDGPDDPKGRPRPIGGHFRAGTVDGNYGDAYVDFGDRLNELLSVHQPDAVAFEAPLPVAMGSNFGGIKASAATIRKLLGLTAICEEKVTRRGIKLYECNVQDVRGHFCNNRLAKKDEVMRTCRILGWAPTDDNVGDAMALWDFARAGLRAGAAASAGPLFRGR